MQLLPLTPEQIRLVLCAMKAVALANGAFSDEERALLEVVSEALDAGVDVASIEPAHPPAIALAFDGAEEREHVVQMLVFTAMVDGDANLAEMRVIKGFAQELGIDDGFIEDVRRIAAHHLNMLRLDMVRRLPPPAAGEPDAHEYEGWRGLWKVFGAASRTGEDAELAWRYKSLSLLPEGTLGREYWAHMTERQFLLPGEHGAILPGAAYHDFLHVLCGYNTTTTGEAEMTAFTAGLMKSEDPFAMIFGTLCMARLGERLGHEAARPRANLDSARVAAAFRRGLLATVDFTDGWNYWADVTSPIAELWRRYNIFTG